MDKEYKHFLQTEYSEISSYFTNAITFRFTVFGFYIAAIGIIISSQMTLIKAFFCLFLNIVFFIMEMRNRTLSGVLEKRGKEIEEILFSEKENNQHFFHRLDWKKEDEGGRFFGIKFRNKPILIEEIVKVGNIYRFYRENEDIHNKSFGYVYFLFSHSFAIDISLFLATLYSFYLISHLI